MNDPNQRPTTCAGPDPHAFHLGDKETTNAA